MSEKKQAGPGFTKAQFLKSMNFTPVQKDVLSALMQDGETYTLDQANKLISEYAKRTVE